jgi:hypothetical protein
MVSIRLIKVLWPGKLLKKSFSDFKSSDLGPIRSQTRADKINAHIELFTKPLEAPHIAYVVGPDLEIGNILGDPRGGNVPMSCCKFGLNSFLRKRSQTGMNESISTPLEVIVSRFNLPGKSNTL